MFASHFFDNFKTLDFPSTLERTSTKHESPLHKLNCFLWLIKVAHQSRTVVTNLKVIKVYVRYKKASGFALDLKTRKDLRKIRHVWGSYNIQFKMNLRHALVSLFVCLLLWCAYAEAFTLVVRKPFRQKKTTKSKPTRKPTPSNRIPQLIRNSVSPNKNDMDDLSSIMNGQGTYGEILIFS